ncbi:sterol-4alpha-carboxylate 3-dehydrogenase (decarboxylating) [Klebsormidium nitens]|uniref:Reticulon-like protein n=1 Tax=Klebsormidium nitens TaxID=105231 RepID=A0A1Y1HYR4_KLENI|nr:sterol-4alpha-carboxylate 3-dehydrogenase (decarboxylating) [Klebsormidium nitens]|eukprot:GAQ83800.1 sterol-4alpha-carboxylate 3-dehydrogenase (decarboxylating) [Klebsormidium nitens]
MPQNDKDESGFKNWRFGAFDLSFLCNHILHCRLLAGDTFSRWWLGMAAPQEKTVCLVTGGNGFVGQNLITKLVKDGTWKVVILDIAPQFRPDNQIKDVQLVSEGLANGSIKYICGDLRKKEQVVAAVQGVSVIFHVASPDPNAKSAQLFEDVNVKGTRFLLDAAAQSGVKKFVFTSSASVVFDGTGIAGGDESMPYPKKPLDHYTHTKAQAEQLVLKANGVNGLLTVAVRPSGIFGPGDKAMIPNMVALAQAGKLSSIVGDGKNLWDFTYIDNVVHGHQCAEKALKEGSEAAGKAFFISNGEPYPFWTMTFDLVGGLGYPKHKYVLPAKPLLLLAVAVHHLLELLNKVLGPVLKRPLETAFTPSRIRLAIASRYYNVERARKLLGYEPVVPLKEGIRRAIEARPDLRKEVFDKQELQRIDTPTRRALGGGALADLVLWRSPLKSAALFSATLFLLYHFLWSPTNLVNLLANLLLWIVSATFVAHLISVASSIVGRPVRIPDFQTLEVSDAMADALVRPAADAFNAAAAVLHATIHEKDVVTFSKIFGALLVLRWLGSLCDFRTLVTAAVCVAFILPPAVQKYEAHLRELYSQAVKHSHRFADSVRERLGPAARESKLRKD